MLQALGPGAKWLTLLERRWMISSIELALPLDWSSLHTDEHTHMSRRPALKSHTFELNFEMARC